MILERNAKDIGGKIELTWVKMLSWIFSRISLPGAYRLARVIYPFSSNVFQKGVWLEKTYLQPDLNLRIWLFSKDLIDHKVLFSGVYEGETNWVVKEQIKSGDIVIEAGANSGTETLLISRIVGSQGLVHAFEPVAKVSEKLRANLNLNGISNVMIHTLAVGEETKMIKFFVLPESHPNQGMGSKTIAGLNSETIEVKQVSLDSLKLPRVDFLKMDVQGAEMDILRGARECLSRCRPKILLEATEGWSNINDMFEYLERLKYNVFYISPSMQLMSMRQGNLRPDNWLAVPMPS